MYELTGWEVAGGNLSLGFEITGPECSEADDLSWWKFPSEDDLPSLISKSLGY